MGSLLNGNRPSVFCPGCGHDRIVHALDRAFQTMGLTGEQIAIVTDIGCSGLFDVFFNTHAFHGLHGRALTYATGIKLARPDLHVIVTMGDGGLGIGGAHVLSTCRRNIDVTLLVLNNFNYGMTGGQCSSTTPPEARVGSGFLNQLERPVDICQLAGTAGAGRVSRASVYQKDLSTELEKAIRFNGFSLVDIHGLCPGRYTKHNTMTPKSIEASLAQLPPVDGFHELNARKEYGQHYREQAALTESDAGPLQIEKKFEPPGEGRREVVILGSAGQRIVTAGELLCLAGITAGLHASQKNDYPITVLRGHSVSELILSEAPIGYTGIDAPLAVIALAPEGVQRRRAMFARLGSRTVVLKPEGLEIPACDADVTSVDFKSQKIKSQDWALAALALLAGRNIVLTGEMLAEAMALRFKGAVLEGARALASKMTAQGEVR